MFINYVPNKIETTIFRVDEIRSSYIMASNGKQKCLLYNVPSNIGLYDVIEVKGKMEKIASNQNLGTFHFANYMKHKGVYESMYVTSVHKKAQSNHMKAKLYRHIQSIPNETTRDNMNTLLYRQYEELMEYKHFLFASGIHLHFLIGVIVKVLHRDKNTVASILSFLVMMLLPFSPYMLRMFIFAFIPLVLKHFHHREQLGVSIIVLLLIQPSMAFEVTFIIPVCLRLVYLFAIFKIPNKVKLWLVLIPVQLWFFHEVNLLSLLFFPVLKWMQGILFIVTLLSLLFTSFHPFLNIIFALFTQCLALLPLSFQMIGKPFFIWMLLWCIVSYLFITYQNKKYICYLFLLLIFQWQMKNMTIFGEVTFLDVNQGDCILIREPMNGKVMLIDVANKINQDYAKTIIYPVLKAKGIMKIDYVLITHDDYDHSGGLKSLQKLIKIDQVITNKQNIQLKKLNFSAYQSEDAKNENDKSIILYSKINGLHYLFMGDASKEVEKEFIAKYNQLRIDVLKVGHHGSNTSSNASFIAQIQPKISVISSGRNNRYRHPHQEVIDILNTQQSFIVNTQHNGSFSILYSVFGNVMMTGDGTILFNL